MISVIMPVYNQDEIFLFQAIESVFSQTNQDFELIIVDDGSTTDIINNVVKEFNSDKIKIIKHSSNMGIGYARNTGVKHSKGEYIAFLSSDDIWKVDFLKTTMNNLKDGIVFCDYDIILKNGSRIITKKVMPEDNIFTYPKQNFEKLVKNVARSGTLFINYSCLLGEKKYFEKENAFLDELRYGEDLHHIVKICNKANFTYLPESLIMYRWHEGNTTHKVAHTMDLNNAKIFELLRKEGIDI